MYSARNDDVIPTHRTNENSNNALIDLDCIKISINLVWRSLDVDRIVDSFAVNGNVDCVPAHLIRTGRPCCETETNQAQVLIVAS